MIDIENTKTLLAKKWNRYIAYLHRVPFTVGWGKPCVSVLPLDRIYPEFELLETVHFESYIAQCDYKSGLVNYMENWYDVILDTCNAEQYQQYILEQYPNLVLPARQYRSNPQLLYWKDYFPSYQVEGFPLFDWVFDSPYSDEINIPQYYQLIQKEVKKTGTKYLVKNIHAQ